MKGAGGNIPNAKTPGRNGAIDAAKAMAFFLMVLGHLIQIHSQPSRFIFAFHMPAFFFLSGYTYREKGFRTLAVKKLRGLMLPYAGFALAGLVVTLAMGERPALRELLYQLFYKMQPEIIHVGQLWFLPAVLMTTLLFWLVRRLERGRRPLVRAAVYAGVIAAAVAVAACFVYDIRSWLPFKLGSAVIALPFFAAGFYAGRHDLTGLLGGRKLLCAALIPAGTAATWLFGVRLNGAHVNVADCRIENPILFFTAALCGITMLLAAGVLFESSRVLRYYGKNTLWMFALHSLVILAVMAAVRGLTGEAYRPLFNIPHKVSVPAALAVTVLLAPVGALGSLAKKIRLRGRGGSAAAQNDEKTEKDRVR